MESITQQIVRQKLTIIKQLVTKDKKGPEKDKAGFEGEIWIFTPIFQNIKLYIKIRLANNTLVICISIHEYGIY